MNKASLHAVAGVDGKSHLNLISTCLRRVVAATHEWLRRAAFEARVSQQALIDEALDLLRAKRSHG